VKIDLRAIATYVLILAGLAVGSCSPNPSASNSGQVSRITTILGRGSIRCSYLIYPPYLLKDANTGKLSGIMFDLMEEIGRASDLKIEWVEEVGYESIFTSVNSGREDLFCGGLWPNASRARAGTFSVPIFYSVVKAWGRSDETRFAELSGVNLPDVRIATIDGAMEDIIAKTDYPAATRVSLPQLSPFTQNLLNLTSRKADLTFAEPGIIFEFLKSNPGSLKELAPNKPARIFGNTVVVPKGDYQLKEFVDVALTELLYSGRMDSILKKYEPVPGVFPRATLPYDPTTAVLKANQ
jgi:polar amino acid transport system substrate-binding protein